MRFKLWINAVLLALASTALQAQSEESWDGLVEIKPKRLDVVQLLPGADFSGYSKVMLDPTEVAFRKDWLRDANQSHGPSRRITEANASEILDAARSNFADVFVAAFSEAGYSVVDAPAEDVLRISTAVVNIDINAPLPDSAVGRVVTFVADAGQATLIMEARDSQTNALLGRVADRREARHPGGQVTRVSNRADFRALFREWAKICVRGLEELKAHSPVPSDLKPGQKL